MGREVSWVVELELKDGRADQFRALSEEMVGVAQREPGTIVYERYANVSVAAAHLRTFHEQFGDLFATLVTRKRFAVFGPANDEVKELLDGFGATYLTHLAGFSRH